jgi:hypothetical protein
MNFSIFLAALKAAALAAASSFGTAFAAGLSVIGVGFLADERAIAVKVMDKFHATLDSNHTAGMGELAAIEGAMTAAFNEFCHDEAAEFVKEADAIITLLGSSAKSAAGLK